MSTNSENNKRIAKNTVMLYFRMLISMAVSLYTSRVVLRVLGVDDFGIYNVVGGVVGMFSILSGSLSAAISRFITFELGKGDTEKLKRVFSSSINIQILLSVIIVILIETIGIWFLNNKMVIPPDRMGAAHWVFQFSIVTFVVGLLSVPYNATIIAHEKMSAFAYISIIEVIFKLVVAFVIIHNPFDRLVFYGLLLLVIGLVMRSIYAIYCKRHFEEATYHPILDKSLLKEMFSFAGWNFLGNGAYILNTQGVNMVMNIFFGVTANAARGIANQVNTAVNSFVSNFMTAMNPQITKSYASGDKEYCYKLVCKGAKYSILLMYILSLPVILESDTILNIWLTNPPKYSSTFLIWTLLGTMATSGGNTLYTLMMAHGDIKRYQIIITLCGFLPFPLTWIIYELGANIIWTYIIYFIVYYFLLFVRLWLVHNKTGIPNKLYLNEVIFRTHAVIAISFVCPYLITTFINPSFIRLILTTLVSVISTSIFILLIGIDDSERNIIKNKIFRIIHR